jgi:predicted O-methyltransferase YrrM
VTSVRLTREDAGMHDDGPRWNERYAATVDVDARMPEAFERWPELVERLPRSGRAVDVASGPGATTLWLGQRGLDVVALDVSQTAIDVLRRAASARGLAERVDARAIDLDDGLPADLTEVDLVLCQRFRDPRLYEPMLDRLCVGGVLVVTVLSTVGAAAAGAFHAPAGELAAAFGAAARCEILHSHEGDGVAHLVACRR